jgi:hypothetical protein
VFLLYCQLQKSKTSCKILFCVANVSSFGLCVIRRGSVRGQMRPVLSLFC